MDLGLANARALVTGGSQGIGRAIAAALVAEGARVAICARSADEVTTAAQGLARSVEGGADVHAVVADVAVPDGAEGAVAAAVAQLGGLDLLVGNVGGAQGGGLEDSSAEDWAATFELNVGHCVRALRAALPALRASDRAAALFISSISGRKPAPRAQYGAAKAATSYAAAALARELAPERIRVNALSPGSILFPDGGWDQLRHRDPERFEGFVERDLPWGRLGTAEEVADAAAFVLSPRARWINGTDLAVDGAQGRPGAGGW